MSCRFFNNILSVSDSSTDSVSSTDSSVSTITLPSSSVSVSANVSSVTSDVGDVKPSMKSRNFSSREHAASFS